jgi:ribulose-5-phosphate 4-epimerase/fuculose-1-phosphate aldolase
MGKTIGDAFMHMYDLIRACQVQIQVMSTQMKPIYVDHKIVDGIKAQAKVVHSGITGGQKAWPAMMRKVQRTYPDFAL